MGSAAKTTTLHASVVAGSGRCTTAATAIAQARPRSRCGSQSPHDTLYGLEAMRARKGIRPGAFGVAVLLSVASFTFASAPASAAVTIKVKPSTGLVNGQSVAVKSSGLLDKKVEIRECSDPFCDPSNAVLTRPQNGVLKAHIALSAGFMEGSQLVNCAEIGGQRCDIVVIYAKTQKAIGTPVPISFAPA